MNSMPASSHLTDDEMQDYLDGDLDIRASAGEHAATCRGCQRRLDEFRRLDSDIRQVLARQPGPPTTAAVALAELKRSERYQEAIASFRPGRPSRLSSLRQAIKQIGTRPPRGPDGTPAHVQTLTEPHPGMSTAAIFTIGAGTGAALLLFGLLVGHQIRLALREKPESGPSEARDQLLQSAATGQSTLSAGARIWPWLPRLSSMAKSPSLPSAPHSPAPILPPH